jgi:hypothetical protein
MFVIRLIRTTREQKRRAWSLISSGQGLEQTSFEPHPYFATTIIHILSHRLRMRLRRGTHRTFIKIDNLGIRIFNDGSKYLCQ